MYVNLIKCAIASALVFFGAGAQASAIVSNSTYGVFDGTSGIRTFNVSEHGTVTDVNVLIEFSKCDDPAIGPLGTACIGPGNSFDREIVFRLTSAGGVTVDLVTVNTYSGQAPGAGRVEVMFDDEATAQVGNGGVRAGLYRPVGFLGDFDGMDMFGTWSLFIQDVRGADPLEFFSARLDIASPPEPEPSPVPEPASLAILGLGLLGIGAARRTAAGKARG